MITDQWINSDHNIKNIKLGQNIIFWHNNLFIKNNMEIMKQRVASLHSFPPLIYSYILSYLAAYKNDVILFWDITKKNIKSNWKIAEYFLIKETTEKIITPRVCLLYELIKKILLFSIFYVYFVLFLILISQQNIKTGA